MLKNLYFIIYSFKKNIANSAELRTSFLMSVVGMMFNNVAFIFLWVFFVKQVGVIGGWTALDIIALQGFTAFAYGATFTLTNGLYLLPEYVSSGSFDRFMLSPKNLLIRLAGSSFQPSAVGDLIFGVSCLMIYVWFLPTSFYQIGLIVAGAIIASLIFFALDLMINCLAFFMTDAQFVVDGVFQLFFTPALFHGGAFQGALRFVFTFIIPSLLIGTIPVEVVKNTSFANLSLLGILAAFWVGLAVWVFYKSVRRYESANFMTFGS